MWCITLRDGVGCGRFAEAYMPLGGKIELRERGHEGRDLFMGRTRQLSWARFLTSNDAGELLRSSKRHSPASWA